MCLSAAGQVDAALTVGPAAEGRGGDDLVVAVWVVAVPTVGKPAW